MLSEAHTLCDAGLAELVAPAAPPLAATAPHEGVALLDPLDIEALVLNLDASLQVHARSHFFAWTQGMLRNLLRHEVLICIQPVDGLSSFRIDSFSTLVVDADVFSEPLVRDNSLAGRLIEHWCRHGHRPVLVDPLEAGIFGRSALAGALERVAATQVVMHGCHGVNGEVTGFFVFACWAGTLSPRLMYCVQLVVPFLHAAWMRAQLNSRLRGSAAAHPAEVPLTVREQQVLRWIYLGKTNSEIGSILGISYETVKDHVQNLFRKLNVVNRAQAVGRALEARILTPAAAVREPCDDDFRRRRPTDALLGTDVRLGNRYDVRQRSAAR